MPVLIVPPLSFVTENAEVRLLPGMQQRAASYQENLLRQLGFTQNQEQQLISSGAYGGTRIFSWNKPYSAYLSTSFVFPLGPLQKQEFLHSAMLVKMEDCVSLGGVWEVKIPLFPLVNSLQKIEDLSNRTFRTVSPVKTNTVFSFDPKDRMAYVLDLLLGEKFSAKGVASVTNFSRLVCQGEFFVNQKKDTPVITSQQEGVQGTRAHKLVLVEFLSPVRWRKEGAVWPLVSFKVQLNSGVFSEKNKNLWEEKKFSEFHPEKISTDIVEKVLPELQDFNVLEFKIIRRYRGWVYLDKGRALGALVGMRLVGPGKAQLHIIRYTPETEGVMDASVAFIRDEDDKRPLRVGDILKVDPTVFPKSKK